MNTHSSYRLPSLVPVIALGNAFCFLRRWGITALVAVAVLSVSFFMAEAGSNIKQKDTGATVWENQDGDQIPVGDSGLTVLLENVSSASTAFVVTHRAGNIVKIYSAIHGVITVQGATLDFGSFDGSFADHMSAASGVAASAVTLEITTGAAGDLDSVTFVVGSDGALAVTQGQVIFIHTDGGSTTDIDATITIIIE
ncbi:hypothetical protein LCGC14_2319070 [marine sediment metagenome]|uniref:Uncharacterized protein n=1 Tax=marine sediment metagenome TaxID=412755 RepID=A0A0F9FD54_9ZZZZ